MNFADLTNAGFPTWDELLEDLKSRGSDWEDINAYRREYWKTLLEVDEVKNMKEEERKKYEEEFFPSAGIARSGLAGLAGGIVREIPSAISDVAQSGYEAMKPFLYGAPLALADQIDKVRDWVTGNERQSDLLQKISDLGDEPDKKLELVKEASSRMASNVEESILQGRPIEGMPEEIAAGLGGLPGGLAGFLIRMAPAIGAMNLVGAARAGAGAAPEAIQAAQAAIRGSLAGQAAGFAGAEALTAVAEDESPLGIAREAAKGALMGTIFHNVGLASKGVGSVAGKTAGRATGALGVGSAFYAQTKLEGGSDREALTSFFVGGLLGAIQSHYTEPRKPKVEDIEGELPGKAGSFEGVSVGASNLRPWMREMFEFQGQGEAFDKLYWPEIERISKATGETPEELILNLVGRSINRGRVTPNIKNMMDMSPEELIANLPDGVDAASYGITQLMTRVGDLRKLAKETGDKADAENLRNERLSQRPAQNIFLLPGAEPVTMLHETLHAFVSRLSQVSIGLDNRFKIALRRDQIRDKIQDPFNENGTLRDLTPDEQIRVSEILRPDLTTGEHEIVVRDIWLREKYNRDPTFREWVGNNPELVEKYVHERNPFNVISERVDPGDVDAIRRGLKPKSAKQVRAEAAQNAALYDDILRIYTDLSEGRRISDIPGRYILGNEVQTMYSAKEVADYQRTRSGGVVPDGTVGPSVPPSGEYSTMAPVAGPNMMQGGMPGVQNADAFAGEFGVPTEAPMARARVLAEEVGLKGLPLAKAASEAIKGIMFSDRTDPARGAFIEAATYPGGIIDKLMANPFWSKMKLSQRKQAVAEALRNEISKQPLGAGVATSVKDMILKTERGKPSLYDDIMTVHRLKNERRNATPEGFANDPVMRDLTSAFTSIGGTEQDAMTAMGLIQRSADARGISVEQMLKELAFYAGDIKAEGGNRGLEVPIIASGRQRGQRSGEVTIGKVKGLPISIYLGNNATPRELMGGIVQVLTRALPVGSKRAVESIFGATKGRWTRAQQRAFGEASMRYVDTGKSGNSQLDSILNTVFNPEADRGAPSGIGEFVYQPFGGLTAAAREARSGNREKMDRYNRAWGMRQSGVPDRQIYDQTGWFVGEDGMWRFGFDSGKMKIDQRAVLASHTTGAKTSVDKVKFKREDNSDVYIPIIGQMSLGEIVRFPELFIDYPELRKIPVFTIPDSEARAFGFSGLWIPNRGKQREWFNKNLYHINPIGAILVQYSRIVGSRDLRAGPRGIADAIEKEGTLVHEIQHVVQQIEGWRLVPNSDSPTVAVGKGGIKFVKNEFAENDAGLAKKFYEKFQSGETPGFPIDELRQMLKEEGKSKSTVGEFVYQSRKTPYGEYKAEVNKTDEYEASKSRQTLRRLEIDRIMRIGQLEEKLKAAGAWDTAALTKSEEQILDVIKETIPPDRVRMKGREFDILDPKQVDNLYRFFTDAEANDALLLGKIESTIDDTLRLGAQVVKREKAALALGANPGQMAVIGAERSRIVKLLQQSLRLRDTHASFHARGLVAHRWLRRPSESGGVESKASEAANVSASMMRELEKAAAEIQREVTDSKKLSNNAEFVYQLLEMAAEDPNFSFKDAKRVLSKYEVEPSAGERAFDALIEYRTNALFSSPVTQAIAAGTSFSLAALHFPRIAIAAALERVLPGLLPKSHTMTGFKAMMSAQMPAMAHGFREAMRALYAEYEAPFLKREAEKLGETTPRFKPGSELHRKMYGEDIDIMSPAAKVDVPGGYDKYRAIKGTKGKIIRTPTTFLVAFDRAAKGYLGYMVLAERAGSIAELAAKKGEIPNTQSAIKTMMEDVMSNPEKYPGVAEHVARAGHKVAFTTPFGPSGKRYERIREETWGGRISKVIMPVMKSPVNIFKMVTDVSPLGLAKILWDYSRVRGYKKRATADVESYMAKKGVKYEGKELEQIINFRTDVLLKGTGVKRQTPAEISERVVDATIGTLALALGAQFYQNGIIQGSGPSDPTERRNWFQAGNVPHSIRLDRLFPGSGILPVSYARAEPWASIFGTVTTFGEAMESGDESKVLAALSAVRRNMLEKTFWIGIEQFSNVVNDPERYWDGFQGQILGSIVQPWSVAALAARMIDPTPRYSDSPKDQILARVPGISKSLPPKYWATGEEMSRKDPGLLALTPFSSPQEDILAAEMDRINTELKKRNIQGFDKEDLSAGLPISLPRRKVDGTEMSNEDYAHYMAEIKKTSDTLRKLISQPGWKNIPDERKAEIIKDQYRRARARARLIARSKTRGISR